MDVVSAAHLANALCMISVPIALAAIVTACWKEGWRPWLVAGGTFLLSQVGHVPFNFGMGLLLGRTPAAGLPEGGQRLLSAVLLGLSAGLFEELFRYGMFRWWLKDARSWRRGVLAGAGHGGGEAILFGTLALYGFLQLSALRGVDLSSLLPADRLAQALQQVSAYWSMTWYESLLGGVERLLVLPTQIALALLVLQAFVRKQWGWVGLAVAYHALLDTAAVLALPQGVYLAEAVVAAFAVVSLVLIAVLRRPEPTPDAGPAWVASPPAFVPRPVDETPPKLDETRYV